MVLFTLEMFETAQQFKAPMPPQVPAAQPHAKPRPDAPAVEPTADAPDSPDSGAKPGESTRPAGSGTSDPTPEIGGDAKPVPAPTPAEEGFGRVEGTIKDAESGTLIGQAEVMIPELDIETFTNHKGVFAFPKVPARERAYEVMIVRPGYENAYFNLVVPATEEFDVEYTIKRKGF